MHNKNILNNVRRQPISLTMWSGTGAGEVISTLKPRLLIYKRTLTIESYDLQRVLYRRTCGEVVKGHPLPSRCSAGARLSLHAFICMNGLFFNCYCRVIVRVHTFVHTSCVAVKFCDRTRGGGWTQQMDNHCWCELYNFHRIALLNSASCLFFHHHCTHLM